jgi:hypothetical protein
MIRRPLNERFSQAVLECRKVTTIRDSPWPTGKPIMLFCWSGKPYRSKQISIAPVIVELAFSIVIRRSFDDVMTYNPDGLMPDGKRWLWETEGFNSQVEMDNWFRPLLRPQDSAFKSLMRFRLATNADLSPLNVKHIRHYQRGRKGETQEGGES